MNLRQAVAQTLAYGGYFNYPLSPSETHFWLISPKPVSKNKLHRYLPKLSSKDSRKKVLLLKNTHQKVAIAQELANSARFIPTIRLIALTGSIAANNTKIEDDIDLLVVASPHTLWLTRPLLLLLLSLKFNRRHPGDIPSQIKNSFCPNLWLDTTALKLPKLRQNIYTAHEVLQVKPLFDRGQTYQDFLSVNRWTKKYLANAYLSLSQKNLAKQNNSSFSILSLLLIPLNYCLFLLQYLYMRSKITSETVSLHSAFFHKNDPSKNLSKYLQNNSL